MLETKEDRMFAGFIGGCIALIVVLIFVAAGAHQSWVDWCVAQGGHVDSSTHVFNTVGVGSNGQPVVGIGSTTTYFCLTPDGRIIDVQ